MCAAHGRSRRTTPLAGTECVGECPGRKCVPDFVGPPWKSNDGWMARTGCAFGNVICTSGTARNRHLLSQVLAAYGLQDLRNKKPNPLRCTNPNIMCLPNTPGGNLGSGSFYLAEKRTFLLCVDTFESASLIAERPGSVQSGGTSSGSRVEKPDTRAGRWVGAGGEELPFWISWGISIC